MSEMSEQINKCDVNNSVSASPSVPQADPLGFGKLFPEKHPQSYYGLGGGGDLDGCDGDRDGWGWGRGHLCGWMGMGGDGWVFG